MCPMANVDFVKKNNKSAYGSLPKCKGKALELAGNVNCTSDFIVVSFPGHAQDEQNWNHLCEDSLVPVGPKRQNLGTACVFSPDVSCAKNNPGSCDNCKL